MRVKQYLQLTRAHTAPLETIPAILGSSLAVGSVFNINVLLWGIFGSLYHLFGYGNNSLVDWKKGYDKDDEHKQHHPLNNDKLTEESAKFFIYGLGSIMIIYMIYLVRDSQLAAIILLVGAINGFLYNYIGKKTQFKFIFISIAHTTVFVAPYVALNGSLNSTIFQLGAIYVFTWVVFQISISGEIKDITQDEENFITYLGARVSSDGKIIYNNKVKIYSYTLKIVNILSAVIILSITDADIYFYIILMIIIFFLIFSIDHLLNDRYYYKKKRRHERIRSMSKIEIWMLIILVVSYGDVIGNIGVLLLVVGSILWVIVGNKLLWGTTIGPKV